MPVFLVIDNDGEPYDLELTNRSAGHYRRILPLGGWLPEICIELSDSEASDWVRHKVEASAWQEKIWQKIEELP